MRVKWKGSSSPRAKSKTNSFLQRDFLFLQLIATKDCISPSNAEFYASVFMRSSVAGRRNTKAYNPHPLPLNQSAEDTAHAQILEALEYPERS